MGPEKTQHSKLTLAWTYISRYVWVLLIRHVCPDFNYKSVSYSQFACCSSCEPCIMYLSVYNGWDLLKLVLYCNSQVFIFEYLPVKLNSVLLHHKILT
jgi:hypothetical protein